MRAAILLTLALVSGAAPPARAGDRSATSTRVYLDKEAALERVFPQAERVLELRALLSAEEIARVEALSGSGPLEEGGYYVYAGMVGQHITGFGVIVSQIGKVKPITHIVGVGTDGKVGTVAVMIYRESHGDEVAASRFLEQYRGLDLQDQIRIDRDIINIAGATLSGHAICRGVRKALAVVQALFPGGDDAQARARLAPATDVTPAALRAPADPSGRPDAGAPAGAERDTSGAVRTPLGSLQGEREIMGSLCSVEAFAAPGMDEPAVQTAIAAALDEVAHWDDVLSNWRGDTPLSRLNATPAGQAVPANADLLAWLDDARHWCAATDGAFDPGIGALVDAWQLRTQSPRRPADETLAGLLEASGLRHLVDDRSRGVVQRCSSGVQLDPGASGKGYALDRAAAVLAAHGIRSALLSFRSSLLALGPPPGAAGWVLPVVHDGDGHEVTRIVLATGSLSVSGGAMHVFDDQGVERSHVLDPRSGVPVPAGRLAWVQHASASASDALATALLVSGPGLPAVPAAHGGWMADRDEPAVDWPAHP